MRTGLWACMVAALALLALSCGKSKEEAAEKGTGGKATADVSKDKITIKGEEGEMTITAAGGAELPEGFPKDVPLYKGATVVVSHKLGNAFSLVLQTDDDLRTVIRTYKAGLKAQGWEEESAVNLPTGTVVKHTKGERSVTATIARADEKTQIALAVESGE